MNELIERPVILDVPDVDAAGVHKSEPAPDWLNIFNDVTVTGVELRSMAVTPREGVLGDWFRQGDLGFIYAPRGMGKTWLAMECAHAIADGGKAGPWIASKPRRVLYVDGEMGLDLTKLRDRCLSPTPSENLLFLHHEVLFHRTGKGLNLTSLLEQEALLQHAIENKIEVLFLDNLSCLFRGVKENDADAWELILPWLLQLRRHGIAVVIIAHAGRNGLMRGTSRREDAAVWILALSEPSEVHDASAGARFISRFTKNRNTTSDAAPNLEWQFQRDGTDGVRVICKVADQLAIFRGWIEQGLDTCSEIAAEMNVSNGTVSKLAKRAERGGWLMKRGRRYVLVSSDDRDEPYPD